jgi:cell wall-associated NlpC family hydrolase
MSDTARNKNFLLKGHDLLNQKKTPSAKSRLRGATFAGTVTLAAFLAAASAVPTQAHTRHHTDSNASDTTSSVPHHRHHSNASEEVSGESARHHHHVDDADAATSETSAHHHKHHASDSGDQAASVTEHRHHHGSDEDQRAAAVTGTRHHRHADETADSDTSTSAHHRRHHSQDQEASADDSTTAHRHHHDVAAEAEPTGAYARHLARLAALEAKSPRKDVKSAKESPTLTAWQHRLYMREARETEPQKSRSTDWQQRYYNRESHIEAQRAAIKSGDVVQTAYAFQGTRYVFGGTSRSGFDCSGFTRYVLGASAGVALPRTAEEQYYNGKQIQSDEMKPGDLVFFKNTYRHGISHVGIYVGDNKFVHASNPHEGVRVDDLGESYYRNHFAGARRVVSSRDDGER